MNRKAINEAMEVMHLSQYALAKLSGIDRNRIQVICQGHKACQPSESTRMIKAFLLERERQLKVLKDLDLST